jgi:hypothetical protein
LDFTRVSQGYPRVLIGVQRSSEEFRGVCVRAFAFEGGFVPPSTADFNLPPAFGNSEFTTKPILLVFLSVILI